MAVSLNNPSLTTAPAAGNPAAADPQAESRWSKVKKAAKIVLGVATVWALFFPSAPTVLKKAVTMLPLVPIFNKVIRSLSERGTRPIALAQIAALSGSAYFFSPLVISYIADGLLALQNRLAGNGSTVDPQPESRCSKVKKAAKIGLGVGTVAALFYFCAPTVLEKATTNLHLVPVLSKVINSLSTRGTRPLALAQIAAIAGSAYFFGPVAVSYIALLAPPLILSGVRSCCRSRKAFLIGSVATVAVTASAYDYASKKLVNIKPLVEFPLMRSPVWYPCWAEIGDEAIRAAVRPIQERDPAIPTSYALALATSTKEGSHNFTENFRKLLT